MWKTIAVLVGILSFCLVAFVFYLVPPLTDTVLAPSGDSECAAIRPGMTRQQVTDLIHRRTRPHFEDSYIPGKLVFTRSRSLCTVEFDLRTDTVIASSVSHAGFSETLAGETYE